MKELELKYGCNPNQKPARIFMRDGGERWDCPPPRLSSTYRPPAQPWACR